MFQPAMKAFFFVADEECVVYWGSVYYYRVRTEGWQVLYTTALLDWIIQSYLQWYIVVLSHDCG